MRFVNFVVHDGEAEIDEDLSRAPTTSDSVFLCPTGEKRDVAQLAPEFVGSFQALTNARRLPFGGTIPLSKLLRTHRNLSRRQVYQRPTGEISFAGCFFGPSVTFSRSRAESSTSTNCAAFVNKPRRASPGEEANVAKEFRTSNYAPRRAEKTATFRRLSHAGA